ncbi:MAG TPA: PAS domain-containing protein [Bacteroidia bacterium]|jgi:hypothetical protein|nr:PAS domain-containing protein [Bacteroidia bacterium]
MSNVVVNKEKFKFRYLPEYAGYLLKNRLAEFVTISIRFCREEELPLLKPLSRFSEEELVSLGMDSNREILTALATNTIVDYITENARKWLTNAFGFIDKGDIIAEDLTLAFFLRRKTFGYFLDSYTKNVVEQKFIIAELDVYTTREELVAYNLLLKMQQEKFNKINADLAFYKSLLLEARELGGMGSFSINFKDQSQSIYTPEYKKILEIDGHTNFEKFINWVHPSDRELVKSQIANAYKVGGSYEVEYRYKKTKEKRIWAKGFILSENGAPIFIRGIIKQISP